MIPHTYTAADFQNLDPDALKAMGVLSVYLGEHEIGDCIVVDCEDREIKHHLPDAAALLIGMVAGRVPHCDLYTITNEGEAIAKWECQMWTYTKHISSGSCPSPLAAALAAYGELVRSEKGAGDE